MPDAGIKEASNFDDLLHVIAQSPDLEIIFLDLHMPGMSGQEALEHLKNDAQTRSIPVLVLSADATAERIRNLMKLGAEAYLTKPLNVKYLIKLIEEQMNARKKW